VAVNQIIGAASAVATAQDSDLIVKRGELG
jgi:hypothetical protein